MTLSKRRNVVAFLKFSKNFKQFLEFFRVFNRDGFNFCPVAMFYREVIDKAYSFSYKVLAKFLQHQMLIFFSPGLIFSPRKL